MSRDELKKALAGAAQSIGAQPGVKSKFAEVITEVIEPNRLTLDFFSSFMPTRQLQFGDSLLKVVKNRGFPVRTMVPGTNHLADQFLPPKQNTLTYGLDTIIAKTRYSLWELRRGELGTIDQFRSQMEDALIDNLVSRVQNLIASTWTASNTPSNYVTTASLSETVLENMINTVLERAGSVKAIVAPRKLLLPIYKMAGVVEWVHTTGTNAGETTVIPIQSILEQWKRGGNVTVFRGIPLVELPQIFENTADNFTRKLVDDTQVLVIGDNAGEVVLYGGIESQEHIDTSIEPPDYSLAIWRSFGMIIDAPENIGIIKVTG